MTNTLFLIPYLSKLLYCFPLARANIRPRPLVPFFQISLKNSELKTTHNTFRNTFRNNTIPLEIFCVLQVCIVSGTLIPFLCQYQRGGVTLQNHCFMVLWWGKGVHTCRNTTSQEGGGRDKQLLASYELPPTPPLIILYNIND